MQRRRFNHSPALATRPHSQVLPPTRTGTPTSTRTHCPASAASPAPSPRPVAAPAGTAPPPPVSGSGTARRSPARKRVSYRPSSGTSWPCTRSWTFPWAKLSPNGFWSCFQGPRQFPEGFLTGVSPHGCVVCDTDSWWHHKDTRVLTQKQGHRHCAGPQITKSWWVVSKHGNRSHDMELGRNCEMLKRIQT